MSFIHFEWIGHIDPSDPFELSLPVEPKVYRPVSRSALRRRIADAPMQLEHMVDYSDDGLVTLTWTIPPRIDDATIQWFVRGLADDDGACVMNQIREIWYPRRALLEFEAHKQAIGQRFLEWRKSHRTEPDG